MYSSLYNIQPGYVTGGDTACQLSPFYAPAIIRAD